MSDHNHGPKEECHTCKLVREAFNDGLELAAQLVQSRPHPVTTLPAQIRVLKRLAP